MRLRCCTAPIRGHSTSGRFDDLRSHLPTARLGSGHRRWGAKGLGRQPWSLVGRTDLLLGDLSTWWTLVGRGALGGPGWGPKGFWIFLIVGLTLASIGMLWRLRQLTRRVSLDSALPHPTNFLCEKFLWYRQSWLGWLDCFGRPMTC